ncbi:hypothetical protein [Variovorax saccharolyticus]|uniref:hypothetical protein n=1 Tax=Variovorax saccharolyticus TaxID=3053516 RepID=UPI00257541EF|nr:hypothetical protein [Variovorax sp. J31P216]
MDQKHELRLQRRYDRLMDWRMNAEFRLAGKELKVALLTGGNVARPRSDFCAHLRPEMPVALSFLERVWELALECLGTPVEAKSAPSLGECIEAHGKRLLYLYLEYREGLRLREAEGWYA